MRSRVHFPLSKLELILINRDKILFQIPTRATVRLGEHDVSAATERDSTLEIAVAHTKVHEEYVPDIILNDIAIVKLKRQVPISGKLRHF